MNYRNLTDFELVDTARALALSEESNQMLVQVELISTLADRFEKVLTSSPSPEKDPNQLEFKYDYLV